MASWTVSEPWANVWLRDRPLQYNASRGRTVRFSLAYKNRQGIQGDLDNGEPRIFSVGSHWHTLWRSYLEAIPTESTNFWAYLGSGGARKYTIDQVNYATLGKLSQISSTNVLQSPEGETMTFGLTTTFGGVTRHFLTRKEDINGNSTAFEYLVTNNTIRLDKVVDVDSRNITFEYIQAGVYSNLISKVIAPHGLTNLLQYDSSGHLTNIIDTVGLGSKMQYDGTNLTALVTPYGTTTFTYFSLSNKMDAVKVTELGIRNHLFLYYAQVDGGKISSSYASYLPSTTNAGYFGVANTFDYASSDKRNSFHWGPRQYETLSDTVRTDLNNGTFNVSNLTSSDYLKGRMNHWLKQAGSTELGVTLSFRREQSPDGATQGQITWFDHAGKAAGAPDEEGSMIAPRFTALKLPSGEARFTYSDRNVLGHPTLTAETYTCPTGPCKLRTNKYEYAANSIDLTRHVQLLAGTTKQVSSNVYNTAHQVVTNFNALGESNTFSYNSKQQLVTMTTPGGLTVSNVYDGSGTWSNFLTQRIHVQINRTESMNYSNGYVFNHTDPNGLTRTHLWDGLGRRVKTLYPDGTARTWAYSNLHVVQITNRLGQVKQYTYNGFRQKAQRIDERGFTNSWGYCSCGTLDSMTDASGKTTTFLSDQAGRRIATLFPDGAGVTNNYDLVGRVTNVIDAAGYSVTNCYNNQGLICEVKTCFGSQRKSTHDMEDHLIQAIDANTVTNGFCYDDLGRRIVATNGLGTLATFTYSSLGLIAQTNQMTNSTGYAYDVAGRKTAETNANGEVTQFKYDASGNLTNLIDAKGSITGWKYDQYGRVTNKTDAAGNVIFTYAYDANGRLTNRWTPAKGNTVYRYDAVGNLTNVDYATSTDIAMQYDANNRLISMVDAVGTTTYSYTEFGALLSEDGPWADDTVSYSYTSNRLRSGMTLLQPNATAWTQSYTYDDSSRLSSITSPAGTFTYSYDPVNNMLVRKLALPNGSYITNGYDALGRMTSTTLKNSSHAILNSHAYDYDDASRRTKQTRVGTLSTASVTNSVDYGYDKIGQLKSALANEADGTSRLHERFYYGYDAAGNLSNRVQNVLTNVFNVDNLNQLTTTVRTNSSLTVAGITTGSATNVTVADNGNSAVAAIRYADATFARTNVTLLNGTNTFVAVAGDSLGRWDTNSVTTYLPTAVTFRYDQNGNLRTNGTRIFEYDDENQLTRITEPNAWKSEFTYDGKMKMRISKDYEWRNGAWVQTNEVRRVYDGMLVVQERDPFNVAALSYTRGKDLSGSLKGAGGIGGLLALSDHRSQIADHSYYHVDGNGNVTCLVDTNQLVVARYLHDPFGNALSTAGLQARANRHRFSSKEWHANSGMVYYGYRWYLTELQRWISRDPVEEIAFQNQTKTHRSAEYFNGNLYWFVANAPLNKLDSWGLAITFNGCTVQQKGDIRQAIQDNCDKAKNCSGCQLGAGPINNLCSDNPDMTFNCRDANWVGQGAGETCAGNCGFAKPGLNAINICPDATDPTTPCGPLGCTIFHELLHTGGYPANHNQDHANFDNCMGCTVTYPVQ